MNSNDCNHVFKGNLVSTGLRFGIVVSRFNSIVTTQLLDGALDALQQHGSKAADIDVAWVPGSFEMPIVARRMATSGRYDAVICLGAVIRGGTPHFEYVSAQVTRGVAEASSVADIPVTFGVLTTDTVEQALDRAGAKAGNKGVEAALSAIETVQVLKTLGTEA